MKIVYVLGVLVLLSAATNANFLDSLKSAFSTVGHAVTDAAGKVVEVAKPLASAALDGLKDHAGEIASTAASTAASALLTSLLGKRDVAAIPDVQHTISNMHQTIDNEINKIKQYVDASYDSYHNLSKAILNTPFDQFEQQIDSISNSHLQVTNAMWTRMVNSLTNQISQLTGGKLPAGIIKDMTVKLDNLYKPTQTLLHQMVSQVGETLKNTAVEMENKLHDKVHQIEETSKTALQNVLDTFLQKKLPAMLQN